MNEQLYITLLSVAGTIILVLLGVLGYFLKENLVVLKEVTNTLQAFREDYSATKERVSHLQSIAKDRHVEINHRLNSHAERLDKHENDIGKLQVQMDKI